MRNFILLVASLIIFQACDDNTASNNCGDGVIDIGEECDGSDFNGDSCDNMGYHGGDLECSSDCKLVLDGCVATGKCGDGKLQVEFENCEGTNLNGATCGSLTLGGGSLSCSEDCFFDTSHCENGGVCGNGVVDGLEECDKTDLNGETCETRGYHGTGLLCDTTCHFDLSQCMTFGKCGDAIIQESFEDCEGADLGGHTCEDQGFYGGTLYCAGCSFDTSDCEVYGYCGDGTIQAASEDCDGTALGNLDCQELNYYGGVLSCSECSFDTSDCETHGYCGDNIVQSANEECDGTELNNHTCREYGYWSGAPSCDATCTVSKSSCNGFIQVATGNQSSFGLDKNGVVWSFGNNQNGKLGIGNFTNSNEATPLSVVMPAGLTFLQIDAGEQHACGVTSDNDVYCWGNNSQGCLGNSTANITKSGTPVEVDWPSGNPVTFSTVSAGYFFTCGITTTMTIYCWGKNDYGQLGFDTNYSSTHYPQQSDVASAIHFTQISLGQSFGCALDSSGDIYCWGRGSHDGYILGKGDTYGADNVIEETVPKPAGVSGWRYIDAGYYHMCAISNSGSLYCWGSGYGGKLGLGNDTDQAYPTEVTGLPQNEEVVKVQCGDRHTCALMESGTMWCWGEGGNYRLGTGTTADSSTPVMVNMPPQTSFTSLSTNYFHGCALDSKDNMWCWGSNQYFQCGNDINSNNISFELINPPN